MSGKMRSSTLPRAGTCREGGRSHQHGQDTSGTSSGRSGGWVRAHAAPRNKRNHRARAQACNGRRSAGQQRVPSCRARTLMGLKGVLSMRRQAGGQAHRVGQLLGRHSLAAGRGDPERAVAGPAGHLHPPEVHCLIVARRSPAHTQCGRYLRRRQQRGAQAARSGPLAWQGPTTAAHRLQAAASAGAWSMRSLCDSIGHSRATGLPPHLKLSCSLPHPWLPTPGRLPQFTRRGVNFLSISLSHT